jgi:hypothetical protein
MSSSWSRGDESGSVVTREEDAAADGPRSMAMREASLALQLRAAPQRRVAHPSPAAAAPPRGTAAEDEGRGAAEEEEFPDALTFTLRKPPNVRLGISFWWETSAPCRAADGHAVIKEVFKGSIAEEASLREGMRVVAVQGTPMDDVYETVDALRQDAAELHVLVLPPLDGYEIHAAGHASGASVAQQGEAFAGMGVMGGKPILSAARSSRSGVMLTSDRARHKVRVPTEGSKGMQDILCGYSLDSPPMRAHAVMGGALLTGLVPSLDLYASGAYGSY